jgi:AraC-like DNA-binding protein
MGQTRQPFRIVGRGLDLAHGEEVDDHVHAVGQLAYAEAGVLTVSTPDAKWIAPPQRAVWIPAGVKHAIEAHGATRMRTLYIDPGVEPRSLRATAIFSVVPLLREMIRALVADPPARYAERRRLETVILDQLQHVDHLALRPLKLPSPVDDRLINLTAILLADAGGSRTLASLARQVAASPRTINRLVAEECGMTFQQLRYQHRLHHALVRLAEGGAVTTVALECGYANPSSFIEMFRRELGETPGRFFD